MDNRWRFLYYVSSELWGRKREARAGEERPGTSEVGEGLEKPSFQPKDVMWTEKSREACGPSAEKSRYSVAHTRTVNRHRWMRRGS